MLKTAFSIDRVTTLSTGTRRACLFGPYQMLMSATCKNSRLLSNTEICLRQESVNQIALTNQDCSLPRLQQTKTKAVVSLTTGKVSLIIELVSLSMCLVSLIMCLMSLIMCSMSVIKCSMSLIKCSMSVIKCSMSLIEFSMSLIEFSMSLI